MNSYNIHHAEFYVEDGAKFCRELNYKYQFSLFAKRVLKHHIQWALCSGQAKFLITQPKIVEQDADSSVGQNDDTFIPSNYLASCSVCDSDEISTKSVNTCCNIALKVKDVSGCVSRVCRAGGIVLKPPRTISDSHGSVETALIKSCVGNVVHTLIDDSNYDGCFLPEFESIDTPDNNHDKPVLFTHIDHVTFACAVGSSSQVLQWYEDNLGMSRFLINSNEDKENGFVIDNDDVGIRLKAFEYWKCAETGLYSHGSENSLKFVIAEALEGQGPNQIDTFLEEHKGDGIQHIGLHSDNIVSSVSTLQQQGVNFVEPPYTYYTEVGKLKDIEEINEDIEMLKKYGILVDNEADPDSSSDDQKYLMQKFTQPLFDQKTFFMEIIQRFGARGFGSGNITALWRSLQAYLSETKN